jgi:cytochrome P450
MFERWMINLDGERHQHMRSAFGGLFTPRRAAGYREAIAERASELLAALPGSGELELVSDFARPLPFSVITGVLGVPPEQRSWVGERLFTLGEGFTRQRDPGFLDRADTAVSELTCYFDELLATRSRDPRADLLSALAAGVEADPGARSDVLANCVFFIEAGHATTTSLIAGGTLLLLQHPDLAAALAANPDRIPGAVEEMLRFITPVTSVVCRPREDVEVDGFRFTTGVQRFSWLAAANRDPSVFPEPDEFHEARDPNPHLAFSAGRHFCLGAPLARLHGEVAIEMLLSRLPGLRLSDEPQWRGSMPLRELERLPLAFG